MFPNQSKPGVPQAGGSSFPPPKVGGNSLPPKKKGKGKKPAKKYNAATNAFQSMPNFGE